ncbi:hypothetical protein BC830DRAFT_1106652 [Chytriomyces sp. MP71]|nr:hypothetical protein BC830DRAFT_1106652 [Chytriomyces sp. MP71]
MNRIRRFSENFTRSPTKGTPLRFDAEDEADPIHVQLGETNLTYENRQWISDSAGSKEAVKELLEKNQALEAENQLLRFKLGVMLDMVATSKMDSLVLQHKLKTERIQ